MLFRVVGRPNERAALHVAEAHVLPNGFEFDKGVGVHKFSDGQMLGCGLQILAQGDHLATH